VSFDQRTAADLRLLDKGIQRRANIVSSCAYGIDRGRRRHRNRSADGHLQNTRGRKIRPGRSKLSIDFNVVELNIARHCFFDSMRGLPDLRSLPQVWRVHIGGPVDIHSLWIGRRLTWIEALSLNS